MDLFPWRSALLDTPRGHPATGTIRPLLDDGLAPAPTAPFGDRLDAGGRPQLPGLGPQDPVVLDLAVASLRRRDPGFDPAALARLAGEAMVAVERAWSTLDPQPSRAYLSPALWASHRARMELYALHGRRNVVDHLAVQSATVVAVEQDGGRDRVTVRIRASSTDYDVDASGAVLRGDTELHTWEEDWVLERATGAATRGDGGLLGGHCPACGAPLSLDAGGLCAYCHAAPTDATHDWAVAGVSDVRQQVDVLRAVLGVRTHVRIDPDDLSPRDEVVPLELPVPAPAAGAPAQPDALAPLRARHPDLDATELTAAARTAFVAWRAAWAAMDSARLRPVATAATVAALDGELAALRSRGLRRLADDPLVEGCRVTAASAEPDADVATVGVVATVLDADLDAAGTAVRGDTVPRRRTCAVVLRRRFSTGPGDLPRCPRCGAPLRASVDGVCDFCRAAVAGGGGDWLLDSLPELAETPLVADTATAAAGAADARDATASAAAPSPLDALRAADPGINQAELLARARECFYAVEAAMAKADTAAAGTCTTPRMLDTLRERFDALAAAHTHRVLAFIDVSDATLAAAHVDAEGMHAEVRIEVSGEDCVVDDAEGTVVDGSPAQRRWSERWTLLRSGGGDWLVDAVAASAPS